MYDHPMDNNSEYRADFISKLLKYSILIISAVISVLIYINRSKTPKGFESLFLIPIFFGIYFTFSKLKDYFLKSITISFFTLVLFFRYLLTPLIMAASNNYSAMFNGADTLHNDRYLAIALMIYEMLFIFIAIEICIKKILNKKELVKTDYKMPYDYPNVVFVLSIFIGILGIFISPNLLEDFNFLYVSKKIYISNRNTLVTMISYLASFVQVFVFIITVKYCCYKKQIYHRYNKILLLIVSLINITFLWSANRMTIFIILGTTLEILLYCFPKSKKMFYTFLISIAVIMVIMLSSYRLFGTTGSSINTNSFAKFFDFKNLSQQMQIYFSGPDSVAGAAAVKEYYGKMITSKTFLNDSFAAVRFINQLPIFLNDKTNATINYFNIYCSNGMDLGLIIPMIGQGYIYFGFLLSPIFSVICVVFLFISERKIKISNDIGYRYVFSYLGMNFALFLMYNYTLIMQNVFGRFMPLFFIVWLDHYMYLNKERRGSYFRNQA